MSKPARSPINWGSEALQWLLMAVAVLGFESAVARPFYIPSGSMLPTLYVGDQLAVTKYPYGYSHFSPVVDVLPAIPGRIFGRLPERGDIVVLKAPVTHDDWIKRVIGLPGDTVQLRNGQLWMNGAPVPKVAVADTIVPVSPNSDCNTPIDSRYRSTDAAGRPVCRFPTFRETLGSGRSYLTFDLAQTPQDDTEAVVVPEGHVFVMGDNRDNSEDSRFDPAIGGIGMLPLENIVGRADYITWSHDGSAGLSPLSWPGAIRTSRTLTGLAALKG